MNPHLLAILLTKLPAPAPPADNVVEGENNVVNDTDNVVNSDG